MAMRADSGGTVKKRVPAASSTRLLQVARPNYVEKDRGLSGTLNAAGMRPQTTPSSIAAPAPRRSSSPATTAPRSIAPRSKSTAGASYSGGTLSATPTGLIAEAAAPAPAPTPLGFDQWKGDADNLKDSSYLSEVASADSEYQNLIDQLTQQNATYRQGIGNTFKNMGLRFTGEDYGAGTWNPEDQLGAYGQAYQGLQNDYSGRGLMDSTFYGEAQQDLNDRFNRQRTDLLSQLTNTNNEFATNKNAAANSRNAARDRALAEAYQRYVAGFGV